MRPYHFITRTHTQTSNTNPNTYKSVRTCICIYTLLLLLLFLVNVFRIVFIFQLVLNVNVFPFSILIHFCPYVSTQTYRHVRSYACTHTLNRTYVIFPFSFPYSIDYMRLHTNEIVINELKKGRKKTTNHQADIREAIFICVDSSIHYTLYIQWLYSRRKNSIKVA